MAAPEIVPGLLLAVSRALQQAIAKKISDVAVSVSKIRDDAITSFAGKMNRASKAKMASGL